jgi:hypothetical protein
VTFPQADADQASINGGQFFRLNTPLSSSGDLYESAQGALAFALGPNSDVSNLRVSYLDESVAGGVSQIILSPDRSFIGRVNARNEITYPKSVTRKGRTLIGVDDIYNPAWRPGDFDSDTWEIVPPDIDVIQYFVNPPSLIPQRSDKTFRFQYLQLPINETRRTMIAVPSYGRKSGSIAISNSSASDLEVGLFGVRFVLSTAGSTIPLGIEQTISPVAPLIINDERFIQFSSALHGNQDYLFLTFRGSFGNPYTGLTPIIITLSDDL